MSNRPITDTAATSSEEQRLEELESIVVRGLQALQQRNELSLSLMSAGVPQASIAARLNKVRAELGADLLTRDAVFAILRRHRLASKAASSEIIAPTPVPA